MPVRATLLERVLLLRLNQGPGLMLDLVGAGGTRAASHAVDLGLFDAMADRDRPVTASELAGELDLHPDGVASLAAFLVELGYLRETGRGYELSDLTERWLLADAERSLGSFLRFWTDFVLPYWDEELPTAVREGAPSESFYDWLDDQPGGWETTQRAFREAASVLGDSLLDAIAVPDGADRLLDVGGGHGEYSVSLCERHPDLHATVFDRPAALGVAEERVAETGLSDRVDTRAGDYMIDDFGGDYDLVLAFNVLHGHDIEGVRRLLGRIAATLSPNGRVAVLDQFAGGGSGGLRGAAVHLQGLNYRVMLGGQVHDRAEVEAALREAGFADVSHTAFRRAPGQSLLQARRSQ